MTLSSPLTINAEIIAGAANAELPQELTDPQRYIQDINVHVAALITDLKQIPESMPWDVVTPEYLRRSTERLAPEAKLGVFWLDQTNQAKVYAALSGWKWQSMAASFARSLNANELIAPALISRSMMELSASVLAHVHQALGIFRAVALSDRPFAGDPEQIKRMEETLNRAIWGTRIGTSMMPDKSPLWAQSPYPDGQIDAQGILTAFHKLVREIPDGGVTAFKVYEWLCDIVHPATQGMRVFWESCEEIEPGRRRFTLKRHGKSDPGFMNAIALWSAGFSAVLLRNTLHALLTEINAVSSRLPTTYQLSGAGRQR